MHLSGEVCKFRNNIQREVRKHWGVIYSLEWEKALKTHLTGNQIQHGCISLHPRHFLVLSSLTYTLTHMHTRTHSTCIMHVVPGQNASLNKRDAKLTLPEWGIRGISRAAELIRSLKTLRLHSTKTSTTITHNLLHKDLEIQHPWLLRHANLIYQWDTGS